MTFIVFFPDEPVGKGEDHVHIERERQEDARNAALGQRGRAREHLVVALRGRVVAQDQPVAVDQANRDQADNVKLGQAAHQLWPVQQAEQRPGREERAQQSLAHQPVD